MIRNLKMFTKLFYDHKFLKIFCLIVLFIGGLLVFKSGRIDPLFLVILACPLAHLFLRGHGGGPKKHH